MFVSEAMIVESLCKQLKKSKTDIVNTLICNTFLCQPIIHGASKRIVKSHIDIVLQALGMYEDSCKHFIPDYRCKASEVTARLLEFHVPLIQ